jgi:hypothetical protein
MARLIRRRPTVGGTPTPAPTPGGAASPLFGIALYNLDTFGRVFPDPTLPSTTVQVYDPVRTAQQYEDFEATYGVRVELNRTYVNYDDASGSGTQGDFLVDTNSAQRRFLASKPYRKTVLGFGPNFGAHNNNNSLIATASGANDRFYQTLAQRMAAIGDDRFYADCGWEMTGQGGWYPWNGPNIVPSDFAAAYRRVYQVMHPIIPRTPFLFNANAGSYDFRPYYPGNDVVSAIGLDRYAWKYKTVSGLTWTELDTFLDTEVGYSAPASSRGNSLFGIKDFAQANGKPWFCGEWANVSATKPLPENVGLGDEPRFIDKMCDWTQGGGIFCSYQNVPDGGVGITLADTPNSRARLIARVKQWQGLA